MKRSMFSKERADKLPNPPSLIGRLASEKENHSRHVKQLSTHNNNLQNSNEQQQTQTDELTKQLCALRNQTETQARQLLTMKKMLGFIADEKKFEQAKVEAAKSKISKLRGAVRAGDEGYVRRAGRRRRGRGRALPQPRAPRPPAAATRAELDVAASRLQFLAAELRGVGAATAGRRRRQRAGAGI